MKRHLTDASVQRLKPPRDKDLEVFDLGYPGLALRVGYGGAKSFILFYRYAGKLRRETLGRWPETSLGAARERWRRTREAVARGGDPSSGANGNKVPALAFEVVVEEWLRRDVATRNRASTAYQVHRLIECDMLPAWRGRRIDTIAKHDVLMLLDATIDRGAPAKARRVYVHAHRLFKWCAGRGLIDVNPMVGLEAPASGSSRSRVLSDSELAAVWHASTDWPFGTAVRLLILTGARREEIGRLTWDEIRGDTIHLEGARTKTGGHGHLIPLSTPARRALQAAPRIEGEFVFTLDGFRPVSAWSRAKARLDKASGVTGWRVHDLRRTVATGMQRLGVGLQAVEAVLGHVGSRAGIVGIYQRHTFAEEKRAALEQWGAHVASIL